MTKTKYEYGYGDGFIAGLERARARIVYLENTHRNPSMKTVIKEIDFLIDEKYRERR